MGACHAAASNPRRGFDVFEARQQDWLHSTTTKWPARWKRDALSKHAQLCATQGHVIANHWLLDLADKIAACKIAPNASDAEITDIAKKQAKRATERAGRWAPLGLSAARSEVDKLCAEWGIQPPAPKIDDAGALARMTDPFWWRRKLRREQGREREAIAIALGYVHQKRDIYISRESFEAERHKQRRNVEILERTEAISEDGEIFTLADLAEHSLSNPTLRRGEMMVRIKGYEEVSRELGHVGIFVTLTCPSRMHARIAATGAENSAYDGTTPQQAQA